MSTTDPHVPLIFAIAPSLMTLVKSAVINDPTIRRADKAEILESLGAGEPYAPLVGAKAPKSPTAST